VQGAEGRSARPSFGNLARASQSVSSQPPTSATDARARAWRAARGATAAAVDHFAARLLGPFAVRAGERGGWRFLAFAISSRRTLGGVPKPARGLETLERLPARELRPVGALLHGRIVPRGLQWTGARAPRAPGHICTKAQLSEAATPSQRADTARMTHLDLAAFEVAGAICRRFPSAHSGTNGSFGSSACGLAEIRCPCQLGRVAVARQRVGCPSRMRGYPPDIFSHHRSVMNGPGSRPRR
jgi:hypothetical protein